MRPRILLVLMILLAGCSTPGGPSGTTPTTDGPSLPRPDFAAPIDISGTQGGREPVIVLGNDGSIYVAAQDETAGKPPHVWVSMDGAKTFRETRPSSAAGGEIDIAVGKDLIFVTQLSPSGNVVSYSADNGQTWRQTPFPGTTYFERELVAVDAAGSAYLMARFGLGALDQGARPGEEASVARSDDGGVTFLPVGRAWDATHEPGTSIGNFHVQGSTLAIAYNCRDTKGVCFARSTDRGTTWSQQLVVARSVEVDNVYPILAMTGARAVVTWSDASDGRLAVWAAASSDNGASWSAPARVSADDETATLPWIAMGGGRTWVVYLSTPRALVSAGTKDAVDTQWRAMAVQVDDRLSPLARGPALPEPVHVGVISKPVGRPGEDAPFDRRFGDFFTVAVDPRGRALVIVADTTHGSPRNLLAMQP